MSQTSSVFWGSKHHFMRSAASLPQGPSLEGVGAERLRWKSQPDKTPRVSAATVTAGGHGGKAPHPLRTRVYPNPHARREEPQTVRAQGPAPSEQ